MFDPNELSPEVIELLVAKGLSYIETDPVTGEKAVKLTDEGKELFEKVDREVDGVRLVYVSQVLLDRYYPALDLKDKGLAGVLGINPEEDAVVVYLHPEAKWNCVRLRLVWEGVLWPKDGGTWDADAVMDLYDIRETIGEDWRGLAWAKLLGEVVRHRDAEGTEWEVLADKPLADLSPLSQLFKKNFWPWSVAALINVIRQTWPDKDAQSSVGAMELRALADRLVAEAFEDEEKYEEALLDSASAGRRSSTES